MRSENQLSELLLKDGHAFIEGLGRFSIAPRSAIIDHIHQNITPPGTQVIFTPSYHLTDTEKNTFGLDFHEIIKRLDKKETVLLKGVGSLYKDFRGEIHFTSSNNNFHSDSFGLPTISFKPIQKQTYTAAIPDAPIVVKKKSQLLKNVADLALSFLIAISLITIGVGVWYALNTRHIAHVNSKFEIAESTLENQRKLEEILDYDAKWSVPNDSSNIDSLEMVETDSAEKNLEPQISSEPINVPIAVPEKVIVAKEKKEKIVPVASLTHYSIALGAFSTQENASALVSKLSKSGYVASISTTANNMKRVTVVVTTTKTKIGDSLSKIQKKFNPQAYLIK